MTAAGTCVHRWEIEPASGPTSLGRCIRCSAEKRFDNFVDTGTDLYLLSPKDRSHLNSYHQNVTRERLARRRGG